MESEQPDEDMVDEVTGEQLTAIPLEKEVLKMLPGARFRLFRHN